MWALCRHKVGKSGNKLNKKKLMFPVVNSSLTAGKVQIPRIMIMATKATIGVEIGMSPHSFQRNFVFISH